MVEHPYKVQPDHAFWSRSFSENFDSTKLVRSDKPLLRKKDLVTSAGSCFASNLVPFIESAGITYIRTEQIPEVFSTLGENLGYANFSAAYGNIYTVRQLLQLYLRSLNEFKPIEDRWLVQDRVVDPFRPGLKFPATSDGEFEFLTHSHLLATKEAFETADVFVFTFGLTEGWVNKKDGSVYPACPGTIAGEFNSKKYVFKNFSVDEIVKDMSFFIEKLRKRNPKIRFILSVSPVPLVATATGNHVLTASTFSKSVLRVAAEELSNNLPNTDYFPAFEIITGPQAPDSYFELDKRNVSKLGVEFVMNTLLKHSGLLENSKTQIAQELNNSSELLSKEISEAECDEIMLEK